MAAHDAGVQVACPGCGETVLQKGMIPVLGEGGQGLRYLCPACARALMVPAAVPDGGALTGGADSAHLPTDTAQFPVDTGQTPDDITSPVTRVQPPESAGSGGT